MMKRLSRERWGKGGVAEDLVSGLHCEFLRVVIDWAVVYLDADSVYDIPSTGTSIELAHLRYRLLTWVSAAKKLWVKFSIVTDFC
jgi:hypothetical protein